MAGIFTPTNQKRLTNVTVVRYKKGGKRFEIACYPNKVQSWRDKYEKNLDEVLQVPSIFTNVSKGEIASAGDLKYIFENYTTKEIYLEILEKGEVQINERERKAYFISKFNEVAKIVADKCIDPETEWPYSISTIHEMLHKVHFCIKPNRNAKQLALEAIKILKSTEGINIRRVEMRLKVTTPVKEGKVIREKIKKIVPDLQQKKCEDVMELMMTIDPGLYREIKDIVEKDSKGKGHIEMMTLKDVKDEEKLE